MIKGLHTISSLYCVLTSFAILCDSCECDPSFSHVANLPILLGKKAPGHWLSSINCIIEISQKWLNDAEVRRLCIPFQNCHFFLL